MDRTDLLTAVKRFKALVFAIGWAVRWCHAANSGEGTWLMVAGWVVVWCFGLWRRRRRGTQKKTDSPALLSLRT